MFVQLPCRGIDLTDYVESVSLYENHGSPCYYSWPRNECNGAINSWAQAEDTFNLSKSNIKFPFYTSFRHDMMKCFTLDLLDQNMPGIQNNRIANLEIVWRGINSLVDGE